MKTKLNAEIGLNGSICRISYNLMEIGLETGSVSITTAALNKQIPGSPTMRGGRSDFA